MRKTFKYRLYPTRQQTSAMNGILEECRWLYNHFLEQRKTTWEVDKKSLSLYEQQSTLPKLKEERPSLDQVYSQVLQNVAVRVDLAFKAFFRRCKAGEKPGYPRFRGIGRYDSFCFPQSGWKLSEEGLSVSKVGKLRIKQHRPLGGAAKTCTIYRTATGKWFVSISCEVEPSPLPISSEQVGIDVGLTSFATLSTGEKIDNPRFFRTDEKALAQAQRKKKKKVAARIHERIANRRQNFAHQHSRDIVDRFGVIVVEDLSVNRMVHNHCLSKSIHDAAWSQFTDHLSFKAAWAGRIWVKVNPAYTSQDCSRCGHRHPKSLSDRVHRCACCGLVLDRDENAARNILRLGLQSRGLIQEAAAL